ncbi:MAG: transposase domain-containing protein, partial [Limisphaerales bacterium]
RQRNLALIANNSRFLILPWVKVAHLGSWILGRVARRIAQDWHLRNGRFEIDSNLVENDVRPSAVGKRRWLFIGHPDAGWRNAVIYTIIQSCRRYGINPQEYLADVLQRLPSMTSNQVRQLLPHQWRKARQAGGVAVQ